MSKSIPIRFSYGSNEELVCLGPVNIPLPNQAGKGCYAAKITTYWLGIPARKYVDSYVVASGNNYYSLKENGLTAIQRAGLLPSPGPKYQLNAVELAWGHSFGIVVGLFMLYLLVYKSLPANVRIHVDQFAKPPSVTDSQLMEMMAGQYSEIAKTAACHPDRLIIVDPSHSVFVRVVDIESLLAELAMPGFPDEELDDNMVAHIRRAKQECFKLSFDGDVNQSSCPYVNAVIVVQPGEKPNLRIIRSLRNQGHA